MISEEEKEGCLKEIASLRTVLLNMQNELNNHEQLNACYQHMSSLIVAVCARWGLSEDTFQWDLNIEGDHLQFNFWFQNDWIQAQERVFIKENLYVNQKATSHP